MKRHLSIGVSMISPVAIFRWQRLKTPSGHVSNLEFVQVFFFLFHYINFFKLLK